MVLPVWKRRAERSVAKIEVVQSKFRKRSRLSTMTTLSENLINKIGRWGFEYINMLDDGGITGAKSGIRSVDCQGFSHF
jgi:hypothetical protein